MHHTTSHACMHYAIELSRTLLGRIRADIHDVITSQEDVSIVAMNISVDVLLAAFQRDVHVPVHGLEFS